MPCCATAHSCHRLIFNPYRQLCIALNFIGNERNSEWINARVPRLQFERHDAVRPNGVRRIANDVPMLVNVSAMPVFSRRPPCFACLGEAIKSLDNKRLGIWIAFASQHKLRYVDGHPWDVTDLDLDDAMRG